MRVHVVGGGLAGLSASLALAEAGRHVTLYEAGPQCGGRCRSYEDRTLGARIDNGNHLLLSGNKAAFAYLRRLGTDDTLAGPDAPVFPFMDLASGARWTLRLGSGRIPWWMFSASRRVPGSTLASHADLARLLTAPPGATVADALSKGKLTERLLAPLAIAVLNTMPESGSAALLASVFRQSLLQGGSACIPAFPRIGLSESFIDPALARLAAMGVEIRTSCRVSAIAQADRRAAQLATTAEPVTLAPGDRIVLATPAPVAASLMPGLTVPDEFESIINLHYRLDIAPLPQVAEAGFIGLIGSLAEWVFVKPGIVSVTISAANRFEGLDEESLRARCWDEVRAALALGDMTMPKARLVREKRATFAAMPAQDARRPGPRTWLSNVVLAGDWTATGLPATIEGAIRSGWTAAEAILRAA